MAPGLSAVLLFALQIPLRTSDGKPLADAGPIEIRWSDRTGRRLSDATVEPLAATLVVEPPAGADRLRVIGPKFISRESPLADAARLGISLLRPATLLVKGLGPGPARVTLLREATPDNVLEERALADRSSEGESQLKTWPGTYLVAIDPGREHPIFVSQVFTCREGQTTPVSLREAPSRFLSLRVKDRSGEPVAGASLVIPENVKDSERLETRLLAARAGRSRVDGSLDLGAVRKDLTDFTLNAEGFRTTRLRISSAADGLPLVPVVLASWPDLRVHVTGHAAVHGPVDLERCETWSEEGFACRGSWAKAGSAPLTRGVATFKRRRPGVYNVRLRDRGSSTTRAILPEDSTAEGTVDVQLPLEEWRIHGRTQLTDGRPVKARVTVGTLATKELGPVELDHLESDANGVFECTLLGPSDLRVVLRASSSDPQATMHHGPEIVVGSLAGEVTLTLDTTGISFRLLDRIADTPISKCSVEVEGTQGDSQIHAWLTSDADGKALLTGLDKMTVKVLPKCDGYVAGLGTIVETSSGELKDVVLRLERAGQIRVTSSDGAGRPVAGVTLMALPALLWNPDYGTPLTPLGTTGPDGQLDVRGDLYGGLPVFAFGAGWALSMERLPGANSCADGCQASISLHPPAGFPGLRVTSASGAPLRPQGVIFYKAGVPIVGEAIAGVLEVNGVDVSSLFAGSDADALNLLPAYLGQGDYQIEYAARSQAGVYTHIPLGWIHLPSAEPVELRAMTQP